MYLAQKYVGDNWERFPSFSASHLASELLLPRASARTPHSATEKLIFDGHEGCNPSGALPSMAPGPASQPAGPSVGRPASMPFFDAAFMRARGSSPHGGEGAHCLG